MQSDDLPWPELGNVSRGATRGNQGQKGALGPPDQEGRSVLQLRVQPGVLAVRLNRRSSEWYRTLDNEVNRALKLTKTYWRKARRRQDYDARADQDHMELHEWLQQLKDKTMSHLEVLMQKGDIQGPPYVMPDDIELAFLRKFIERHNAGIPHNPRLRHLGPNSQPAPIDESMEMSTPEMSDAGYPAPGMVDQIARLQPESSSSVSSPNLSYAQSPGTSNRPHIIRTSPLPSSATYEQLVQQAQSSRQFLQDARTTLSRAQSQTQEAFQRYTACLEAETRARREVTTAEQQRDELSELRAAHPPYEEYSRQSSLANDESGGPSSHQQEVSLERRPSADMMPPHNSPRAIDWRQSDVTGSYSSGLETMPQSEMRSSRDQSFRQERKHSRSWEQAGQVDMHHTNGSTCLQEVPNLPPRKRAHHMVDPSNHNASIMSQTMSLPL
ncbi:hypothetical protein BJ138DRAFT_1076405 [Hygrophoropsis aurantiaca]|uniref:Uncharacterized protein n=1 Tax=Hygrophoropsis aurantiaca TaxID=72124 RepID=A0ACB8ARK8_9AGAM|nr:hypothetical protein BJ138DRAFT_1076405 [Hygrophoropsis aurantiaca]